MAHSEALLQGVVEAAPDAVVLVDRQGTIVLANGQCRAVFDQDPDELVGQSVEVLVPEAARAIHPGRRAGFSAAPNPRPMGLLRLAATRRDGTEFPAEISLAPIEADGQHYISATVRDITARIRDEERFRSLLEAAPDPTVIVDSDATIVLVNDRLGDVFGYRAEELVGRHLEVLAPDEQQAETRRAISAYLAAPSQLAMGALQEMDLFVRHHDGHAVPVEISLGPVETDAGLLVSIALRDISERLRIQAETARLRDELVATVSHELRTPLTSIIGYTELLGDLDEQDLSRSARKLLGVIERNALRELQLVDDLLTMAFLDDERIRLGAEPVDLREVCRTVVEAHRARALEDQLELVLLDADVPPVRGDRTRLTQVVENLVGNALKFTRPGGRVEVGVDDRGSMGVVEVRDTGIGVDPEEKAQLFDRLYRARSAIEAQAQGAGLGLAIARAIVEAHGGWVDLESEVGVGTLVRVAIPYAEPPAPVSDEAPAAG